MKLKAKEETIGSTHVKRQIKRNKGETERNALVRKKERVKEK